MTRKSIAMWLCLVVILGFVALYGQETTTETEQTTQETPTKGKPATPQKKVSAPKEEVPMITCIAPKTLEKGKKYYYARRDAWMKNEPTAKGQKIYRVKENSVFVMLEKAEGGWLKVEGMINDTTKVQGYIYKAFLKPYPPTETPKKSTTTKETTPAPKQETPEETK